MKTGKVMLVLDAYEAEGLNTLLSAEIIKKQAYYGHNGFWEYGVRNKIVEVLAELKDFDSRTVKPGSLHDKPYYEKGGADNDDHRT